LGGLFRFKRARSSFPAACVLSTPGEPVSRSFFSDWQHAPRRFFTWVFTTISDRDLVESRAPNSLKVVPLCRAIGKAPSQKKVEHRAANLIGVPE
jgi:hypothetical protein